MFCVLFQVVANYYGNKKQYEPVEGRSILWAGGRTIPPTDTPECGFDGSKCPPDGQSVCVCVCVRALRSVCVDG